MKKKPKFQVLSKARAKGRPKWIPPMARMRVYDETVSQDKQKWIEFRIVVPTQDAKEQLQAGFEFIHDSSVMDTEKDYMAINAIAHSYLDDSIEEGVESCIIVDPLLFKQMRQITCKHSDGTYFYDTMEFCKDCHKCMAVTSYRG